MMTFKRYALLTIFLATPVYAQWAPETYNSEFADCVPACEKNNPTSHDKCVGYCYCSMDAAQTQFPDHAQMASDYHNKVPETMAALQTSANTCNQKYFGRPARQLK